METVNETSAGQPSPFDFTKEKKRYDKIIGEFNEEQDKVKHRREIRENKKNVELERQKGHILTDETIIPDRTINTNIRIGRGPYLSYITQGKRLLIITEIDKPDIPVDSLELWFTRGTRCPRWKMPWIKMIDGMHTHGGCALEVSFDETKPLHFNVEYIPREHLLFPKKTRDLQAQPILLRLYELTTLQLEEFALDYGFDDKIVKEILDKYQEDAGERCIKIYRALCKKGGVVYNSWYSPEVDKGWLRAPQIHEIGLFQFDKALLMEQSMTDGMPLFMSQEWDNTTVKEVTPAQTMMTPSGPMMIPAQASEQPPLKLVHMRPLPIKKYPLIWFPYEVTENEVILESSGRVALDLHVQEALTSLITSTVNGAFRASRFYPCLKNDPTQDSSSLEDKPLRPGEVYPREIAQFQPNWPNNIVLAITQALQVSKSNEAGHSDYAAMARKDANKTATEMELAQDQAQNNVSADLDTYSSPVLDVLALCFEIARHQAIANLIKRPPEPMLLLGDYNLQCAGDVEFIKRAEDKQNAKEFFNIVKGTPAAEKILVFLIKRFFPDQADEWIQALTGPDKSIIIQQLINTLTALANDLGPELPADKRAALAAVINAASSVVGSPDVPNAAQQPAGPGQDAAQNNTQPPPNAG